VAPSTLCSFATDYEELRRGVLERVNASGHFGLVILLREGVAAWMARASAPPMTNTSASAKEWPVAGSVVCEGVQADMIAVLANMVLVTPEERRA